MEKAPLKSEDFRCEEYSARFANALEQYMRSGAAPANNRSPRALKLDLYDGTKGVLFLLLGPGDEIFGMSSVIVGGDAEVKYAKIYGRFHLRPEVPHVVIDRHFEPATVEWCKLRGITRMVMTINEGHDRTLAWASARIGERRHLFSENPYSPVGNEVRQGFRPHFRMIYEQFTWQYAIFYSPDGKFFLNRDEKALTAEAARIFAANFKSATSNWPELLGSLEGA